VPDQKQAIDEVKKIRELAYDEKNKELFKLSKALIKAVNDLKMRNNEKREDEKSVPVIEEIKEKLHEDQKKQEAEGEKK
jgi:hypothetical protein